MAKQQGPGLEQQQQPVVPESLIEKIGQIVKVSGPQNGSWIQALCFDENQEPMTEPINGDWTYTFAYTMWQNSADRYIYDENYEVIGENAFEPTEGDNWRTACKYLGAIKYFEDQDMEVPRNGSWMYTFFEYFNSRSNGGGGGRG